MFDISPHQLRILQDIRSHPDDTTLYGIAKRLGVGRSSVAKSVRSLERKGYVSLYQVRRFVHLTDKAS